MSHGDHSRDPCPYVILNDFGGAFAMGAIGGGIWHGIKGARNSPRVLADAHFLLLPPSPPATILNLDDYRSLGFAQGERLLGSVSAIKARAPVLGGNFGVWGGLFSTFDCAVKGYRQKEDPWNAIISGFMTGGALAFRAGPRAALGSAIGCGVLLGVFEGVGVLMNRMFAQPIPQMQLPEQAAAPGATPAVA